MTKKSKSSLQSLIKAAAVAVPLSMAANANAAIMVDDWGIDLSGIGGGIVTGIDEVTYNGLYHSVTHTNIGGGADPTIGDMFTVDALLTMTSFVGDSGVFIAGGGKFLNGDYEITAVVTTDHTFTPLNPGVGCLSIIGCFSNDGGTIDLYLDAGTNSNTSINGTGGLGFDDGTKIATFTMIPGPHGGTVDFGTFDGNANASFELTFNSGALLDSTNNPLAIGSTLAFTDSNIDSDPDSNGVRDTTVAAGSLLGICGNSSFDTCGKEDGSVVLRRIPEPSTLALFGIGAVGFGLANRRRKAA